MKNNNKIFDSPIRKYLAQKSNHSFDFTRNNVSEIRTFEAPGARYEVSKSELYLTKKEALKDGKDLSRSFELRPKSGLFLSSSWYEVYDVGNEAVEYYVYEGDEKEVADFLLKLDDEHQHFCYASLQDSIEEIEKGQVIRFRALNKQETTSLDNLIKEKLAVYLPNMQF